MSSIILGLILSAICIFVSWVVSHKYSTLSYNERNNDVSLVEYVPCGISEVWGFLSNPINFENFCHNRSDAFETNNVRVGASFKTHSNHGTSYDQYVVQWNPPYLLAWGPSPDHWSNRINLTEHKNRTEICLTRRFRKKTWKESMIAYILRTLRVSDKNGDASRFVIGHYGLAEDSILKLKKAVLENCHNIPT